MGKMKKRENLFQRCVRLYINKGKPKREAVHRCAQKIRSKKENERGK